MSKAKLYVSSHLKYEASLGSKVCSEICDHEVLMVDDVPFNFIPLQMFLQEKDLNSTAVNSGTEAIRLY